MQMADRAQLGVTNTLINLYGVEIALTRPSSGWETTPGGGQARSGAPITLDPVMRYFSLIDADVIMGAEDQGDRALVHAILLGLPGDDIQKGDQFVGPDGLNYEVRSLVVQTGAFETRAECFAYGI